MNIVEAYIKFRGQLVILISGVSGTGISHLAKNISKDLNIMSISYATFCQKNYDNKVMLPNGKEVINWDSDDVIDWDKFNETIEKNKKNGVVAYSQAFPTKKLNKNLNVDAHIHIKLNKQNLFARRKKYIEEHEDECGELYQEDESLIFNRLTFPYYLQSVQNSEITKFINANEVAQNSEHDYDEYLANEAFDYLMFIIKKWLDNYDETRVDTKKSRSDNYRTYSNDNNNNNNDSINNYINDDIDDDDIDDNDDTDIDEVDIDEVDVDDMDDI